MAASDLQDRLDSLGAGETLKLEPAGREFQGPLTIRNPVILEGQGGTVWCPRGPVLIVESAGVELHNINLEVTANEAGLDGETACALRVAPNLSITLENVSVRGTVFGLDTEEGEWRYPRAIPLGSMKPGQAHEFKAKLVVPVPCRLVSKIDGLVVEPGQVKGGPVEITLKLAALPPGTRVRGEIWLKTALLTRRIAVNGNVLKTEAEAPVAPPPPVLYEQHGGPAPSGQSQAPQTVPVLAEPAEDLGPEPTPPTSRPIGTVPLAPAIRVVSKLDDGQFQSLTEALQGAATGTRIYVKPGLYKESVVLTKRVEIIGDGALADIIIEGKDGPCLEMRADYAVVRGLTMRGRTGKGGRPCPAVAVGQGQLLLESCDLASDSLAAVAVRGAKADPVLRHCRIHDGQAAGLLFSDGAEGVVEDCEIFANGLAGVEIRDGANPSLRRCKIHDGKQAGVLVHDNGRGVLEDCELFGNTLSGVEISKGGDPLLRRCKIHDGKYPGMFVTNDGRGTAEECDIFGNALTGVEIRMGGRPTLRHCRLRDGKQGGLLFTAKALGTIEDCDIGSHPLAGVTIRQGSAPTLRRCKIHHGQQAGILYLEKAKGAAEACEVFLNGWAGVAILHEAEPLLHRCQIREGKMAGLVVAAEGGGLVEECEIKGNAFVGVALGEGARAVLRRCRVNDNGDVAIWAYGKAAGEVEASNLTRNSRGPLDIARGCTVVFKGNKQE
jgi:hypothetical protein